MQQNKQPEPCDIPIADVVAHLHADTRLSPEARALALERVWDAERDERARLRAARIRCG